MKNLFPVILSGGSGNRLWPKSRQSLPKQFIEFENIGSLFKNTLERVNTLNHCKNLIIVSSREYEFLIKKYIKNFNQDTEIILEETSKNTAAAVYFSALSALEKSKNAILCIMPSDHWIEDSGQFKATIKKGLIEAEKNFWVTFGIKPKEISTGFGYIKVQTDQSKDNFDVIEFVEKPNYLKAKEYFESSNYFWNAGIFLVSAKKVVKSFLKHKPFLESQLELIWSQKEHNLNRKILKKKYMDVIENISIDKAVLEHEKSIKLIPFESDWSDIGNWDSMNNLLSKFNKIDSNIILINSNNTHIQSSERLIVGIGLNDITVIDELDATLIFKKGQSEQVKSVVETLKNENNKIAVEHSFEFRPWGKYEILLDSEECKVKRLFVDLSKSLSYQYHLKRSEHWTIVSGKADVVLNGTKKTYNVGESVIIPAKVKHSLTNNGKDLLIIIEVQYGSYFGEDDIIRISDPYNR